ncbi:MAG TPA: ABC transporter substrate-binding protein [Gaiellaceae bacterium]|nr:ABC transporter substrate-binding protein [Gaiellaceae bacterium]
MSSKKMRLGLVLATLAGVGVLASVAVAATTTARSAKLIHVRVGLAVLPPKMTHIGFYVARDKGFFAKNGLDVSLVGEGDGVKSLRGTAAGAFDMAGTSADDVIAAATQGGHLSAVWSYAMPLDTTLVADQSVRTVADLRGKKIAITDPGGFSDVQVRAVLAQAHVSAKDVKIVSLPSRSAFVPAIVSGRVNAAPFHADDGFAAMAQDKKLHVIKSIYQALPNWWYSALAVTDTYKQANGPTIEKFITAMDEADRWIYSHRAETIAIGVKEGQESKDAATKAYDFLKKAHAWTVNDGLKRSRVVGTMAYEHKLGQIPRVPTYGEVVDPTYANAVLQKIGRWKTGF